MSGIHAARLQLPFGGPNIAANDLILTLLAAGAYSYYMGYSLTQTAYTFWIMWAFGILLHVFFSVDSKLTSWAKEKKPAFVVLYSSVAILITLLVARFIEA